MIAFISESKVKKMLNERQAFVLARKAFLLIAQKKTRMPSKIYLTHPHIASSDFRAMPAFIDNKEEAACGVKWISVYPGNHRYGLPTVIGSILLNSPRTGKPVAFIEANTLTGLRTGAVSALASSYLASPQSRKLAIIGAGLQAYYQLKAHLAQFPLKEVSVWGRDRGEAKGFCRRYKSLHPGLQAATSIKECVDGADIVITCTPSRKPLVKHEWIKLGAHINAIGADAKGKEELDPKILLKAKVVVDQWDQAKHSGEINVPYARGIFKNKHLYSELSDIVSSKKKIKKHLKQTTVFDSTGLAVLDIYFAKHIARTHRRK